MVTYPQRASPRPCLQAPLVVVISDIRFVLTIVMSKSLRIMCALKSRFRAVSQSVRMSTTHPYHAHSTCSDIALTLGIRTTGEADIFRVWGSCRAGSAMPGISRRPCSRSEVTQSHQLGEETRSEKTSLTPSLEISTNHNKSDQNKAIYQRSKMITYLS